MTANSRVCVALATLMAAGALLGVEIVVPYVRAAQRQGVTATVMHFCVNNPELARQTVDTILDERTLHEIYLPAFKRALYNDANLPLGAYEA